MIEIQSTCAYCGTELTLAPAELLLLVPAELHGERSARLLHGCLECRATTVRLVDRRLAAILMAKDVPSLPDLELEPAEAPHPENPPDGQAWSADDLIELHDLLATDDWFETLLAASDGTT